MGARTKAHGQVPGSVIRSLLKHGARGATKVVVVYKKGVPSRVFGYEQHAKMVGLPEQVQPWRHRKDRGAAVEPLGGIDAGVRGTLSREDIYE